MIFLPSAAFAQASLSGTVKDTSGAVLPGVTVEASSPALIEKVKSVVTDENGLYRIVDLRPGTYTLKATLTGFSTVERADIVLVGSQTLTIPLEMKVGQVQESITVTGETPVVDVQNTRRENVISSDIISSLPVTRAYGSLLNVTPGLTVDNNGLAATPTMTFFAAHGGNINEGRMMINGMTVAAAFNGGGVSSLTYDTTNVDEVSVLVSGGLGESEIGGPAMNIVPRTGGNMFKGQAFLNEAGKWSNGDNVSSDPALAQSVGAPPQILSSWDGSVSYGGPIKRDKLWFYGAFRKYTTSQALEGTVVNQNAGNANAWTYVADPSVQGRNVQGRNIWDARVTYQINDKNRVYVSQEHQARCEGTTLFTQTTGGCRQREASWIGVSNVTASAEANTNYFDLPYNVTQATWTSPVTSKFLLEAGYSRFSYNHNGGPGALPPDGIFNLIPVTETLAIDGHRTNFVYRGLPGYIDGFGNPNNWRASMSYVTGAHSFKAGYQGNYLISRYHYVRDDSLMQYTFTNRVPTSFTVNLQDWRTDDITEAAAFYAQDTWTHNRLTVQGALRFDRAWSFSPSDLNGTTTTSPYNAAPITFATTQGVSSYKDLSPRVGVSYDVSGNGKTAIKFNYGRYVSPATNDQNYPLNNPANLIQRTLTRNWTDTNKNFVVDCNILNPAAQTAGGDTCGATSGANANFGKPNITGTIGQDILSGWGVRQADSQFGIQLAQQIVPRVSATVGYNRRWWSNYTSVDNINTTPADYEKSTIVAPADSRLPNGGGYPITVYTLSPAGGAKGSFTETHLDSYYGAERTRYWQGVDVDVNARLRGNLYVQAGTTTGRQVNDTCALTALIGNGVGGAAPGAPLDNPDPRNCRSVDPMETTLRGSASWTVPKVDVLVSATMRSQPALELNATILVPNSVIAAQLGHLPSGATATGFTTVSLVDFATAGTSNAGQGGSNRAYAGNRRNQIDMRFAKIFRFNNRRLDVGVDVQNLLNSNYGTVYDASYGTFGGAVSPTFMSPTSVVTPRFVRLNFTFDF
ncbi:MAG TPA: TonB-dependent receptor [Vicinamibacterales bacterium]|nr:TonB-dependent receptor [Vicinamibacterales bacterium]